MRGFRSWTLLAAMLVVSSVGVAAERPARPSPPAKPEPPSRPQPPSNPTAGGDTTQCQSENSYQYCGPSFGR